MGPCPESGQPVHDTGATDDDERIRCGCGADVDTLPAPEGYRTIDHHTAGASS